MNNSRGIPYLGGENFNMADVEIANRNLPLLERAKNFSEWLTGVNFRDQKLYLREVLSKADSNVRVRDEETGEDKPMLMFGSNNYLGLATHPFIREAVTKASQNWGVGIGGPPILNGYTSMHKELEEMLAHLKKKESALLFSSGYNANLGSISAILEKNDLVLYDRYSHASFTDGMKMTRCDRRYFKHNDIDHLQKELENNVKPYSNIFLCVEGVYSMDGDTAPLDQLVQIKKKNNALIILDDAHGTGILGENGAGTCEKYDVSDEIDLSVGTFSKALAVTGGFVSANKDIIDYLRFFSRPYMFSASLPVPVIAAVIAGLKVIANEPERRIQLHENVEYFTRRIRQIKKVQLAAEPEAGIVAIKLPPEMNSRKAGWYLHNRGIFLNAIEYPAVPVDEQRFRISFMSTHEKSEIDYLIQCMEDLFALDYTNF